METSEKQYKYYAFISYSHKDKKEAAWIHKKLTFYRLPSYAREELQRDIKLRPICRDEHSLPPGPLWEMLKENLDKSRFLIVVCSPNSAVPGLDQQHWVNREVEYFAQKNGYDRIIPVIVGGIPNDKEHECFCPALKKTDLLGLDMTQKGILRQKSLTFLAAKLLGLNPDMLWDYNAFEKNKTKKFVALGITAILLLFALIAAFIIDSNRVVVNYYKDYVDSYGLPQGIFELSPDELAERNIHYRFEYQGYRLGKSIHHDSSNWSFFRLFGFQRVLRRVVQANSAGNPANRDHTELGHRPAIQVFSYDNDLSFFAKKLTSITYRNPGGKNGLIKQVILFYDRGKVINGKVEIRTPNNEPQRQNARLTLSKSDTDHTVWHNNEKSPITGYLLERDKHGRTVRTTNIDAYGAPTPDEDGLYSFEYALDHLGRISEKWYLSRKNGSWERTANRDGVSGQIYHYTEANMDKVMYVNSQRAPQKGPYGWIVCREEFDKNGNCVLSLYLDDKEQPALHEIEKVGGYICQYNKGNQTVVQAISGRKDENGNWIPAMVHEYTDDTKKESRTSYASIHWEYNADGYQKQATYKDLHGKVCKSVFSKVAITKLGYNDGKISDTSNFDEKGNPTTDHRGIHHIHIDHNPETGEVSKITLFGLKDGNGIWGNKEVMHVVRLFDSKGMLIEERYYASKDESKPVAEKNGVATQKIQYHQNGKVKRRDLYAPENAKVGIWKEKDVMHVVRLYDTNEMLIEDQYYASKDESNPIANQNGIAIEKIQYYQNGKVKRRDFYAPENAKVGIWKNKDIMHVVRLYDTNEMLIEERYYASKDESNPIANQNGIAIKKIQYYQNGKVKRNEYYAPPGAKGGVYGNPGVVLEVDLHDTEGKLIEERYYASKDESKPIADKNGIATVKIQYHQNRKEKRRDLYAPENAKVGIWKNKDIMHVVRLYDTNEMLIEERYYASKDESNPIANKNGIATVKIQYHQNRKVKRRDYYAPPDAKVGIWKDKDVMHVVRLFDTNEMLIEARYYASRDESRLIANRTGYAIVKIQHHQNGKVKRRDYYAPPDAKGGVWDHPGVVLAVDLYDTNEMLIEERYYASRDESKPVANIDGFVTVKIQYHQNGDVKRVDFYAPPGAKGGVAHKVITFDTDGKKTEERCYDINNKLIVK